MRCAAVVFVLAACGRVSFDPLGDAAPGDGDVARDVSGRPCTVIAGCTNAALTVCGSTCFSICLDQGDQPTQAARCSAAGFHLATIADANEEACLNEGLPTSRERYWIGLEQTATAAQPTADWHWVTGEPYAYTYWLDLDASPPGNPDDFDGVEDGFEQCAWKNSADLMQWEDASCDNPTPGVICER